MPGLICKDVWVIVFPFQVSQSKTYTEGLERKLRSNQQYLANLESRLQHEIVKAAPLMSSNLDALPTAQLQQLVHAQEEALKRARSMLVRGCSFHAAHHTYCLALKAQVLLPLQLAPLVTLSCQCDTADALY